MSVFSQTTLFFPHHLTFAAAATVPRRTRSFAEPKPKVKLTGSLLHGGTHFSSKVELHLSLASVWVGQSSLGILQVILRQAAIYDEIE